MTLGYSMGHITLPIDLFYTCHLIITYHNILTQKVMYKLSTYTHMYARTWTVHTNARTCTHARHTRMCVCARVCAHTHNIVCHKTTKGLLLPLSQLTL